MLPQYSVYDKNWDEGIKYAFLPLEKDNTFLTVIYGNCIGVIINV